MRNILSASVAILALTTAPASAQVRLTMASGQVSISAKNATVAQILAEWSRVGQTKIVNGERLVSTPMTLELNNVSEVQALEILLRGASGYVLAPRSSAANPAASTFDRILIVPTSTAPRAAAATPAQNVPAFQPAIRQPIVTDDTDQVQQRFVQPAIVEGGPPPQMPRPPLQQPQQFQPPQQPQPVATPMPTAPIGVARPGMMVPVPVNPNQQPGLQPPSQP